VPSSTGATQPSSDSTPSTLNRDVSPAGASRLSISMLESQKR
jgi:hypothetical protein